MLEKEIERKMQKLVRERGGIAYKFISPGNPGVPDRIVITPSGAVWFVELKASGGRLTSMQKWHQAELWKRRANVATLYGWDAVKKFLEEVMPNGI